VCSGEHSVSPIQAFSQVRYLRLANLLLPVVLRLRVITSGSFLELQQCFASFRQRPNGNLPRSGPDHFSSSGDNSGSARVRLATLISPAEVRPSSGSIDQGRPPLILTEACFCPGATGDPCEAAPAPIRSNSPVDKAPANTELSFHGDAQEARQAGASDGDRSSMVELQIVVLAVAGSSPVGHPSCFRGKNTLEIRIDKGSVDDRIISDVGAVKCSLGDIFVLFCPAKCG
jgi:hypothetical protein